MKNYWVNFGGIVSLDSVIKVSKIPYLQEMRGCLIFLEIVKGKK